MNSDIAQTIRDVIRKEEIENERKINLARMAVLALMGTMMTVSRLVMGEPAHKTFLVIAPTSFLYLLISFFLLHRLLKQGYHPTLKYILTSLDLGYVIIAIIGVLQMGQMGQPSASTFTGLITLPPFVIFFLLNALSGLRFDFKTSIYCALVSILLISGLGFYDIYSGYFITIPAKILETVFKAAIVGGIALVSGYIGHRSKQLIVQTVKEQVENARKTQELEKARELQLSMLPKTLPQLPNLDIAAYMKTATEVGGDYYDFMLEDDGILTAVIGDATGHGLQAGTMVAATKSLCNALAYDPNPVHILNKISKALKAMGFRGMYMALTIAKFQDHQLRLVAAGMPYTLIYRAATDNIEEVVLKGMPLGFSTDFTYQQKDLSLERDDTTLFMSDGLPEMFNEQREIFGEERIKMSLREIARRSPKQIIEHLVNAGEEWANGRAQEDDVTFIVIKIK